MAASSQICRQFFQNKILQRPPMALQASKRQLTDNLKRKFEQFQRDDGVPVYLKGGISDKILFMSTSILCAIGIANGLFTIGQMAFPKKK